MYRGFKQVCNVFLDLLGALSILSLREGHKREIMQKGHRNVFVPLRFFTISKKIEKRIKFMHPYKKKRVRKKRYFFIIYFFLPKL